jgi:hypothetical protein
MPFSTSASRPGRANSGHRGGIRGPLVRYGFRAIATYCAPRGSQLSFFSIGRSKARLRGKNKTYSMRGDAQPASLSRLAKSRAKISFAFSSKGQVLTAWTVSGFKGLCSKTAEALVTTPHVRHAGYGGTRTLKTQHRRKRIRKASDLFRREGNFQIPGNAFCSAPSYVRIRQRMSAPHSENAFGSRESNFQSPNRSRISWIP